MYYVIFTVDGGNLWRISIFGRCLYKNVATAAVRDFNRGCNQDSAMDKKIVWYKAVHNSLLGKYGLEAQP